MNEALRRQVSLGHVPKIFKVPIRGFHDLLRQATLSVDLVGVEFTLNGRPDSAVHISGFHGEDGSIVN
jgi:hypothetical protein